MVILYVVIAIFNFQVSVTVYQAVKRLPELVAGLCNCSDNHWALINEVFIIPLQV